MRRGSGILELVVGLVLVVLVAALVATALEAAQPTGTPANVHGATVEQYVYGYTKIIPSDSTPVTTYTTDADSNGVHTMYFFNSGTEVVYITVDETTPAGDNFDFIVPAGGTLNVSRKAKVSTIKAYSGAASTVYLAY